MGHTLGEGYRIEALIGQGAMGAVYRARAATGAEVALKALNPELSTGEIAQRFLRESALARGLKHPHVVRTLDSGRDATTGLMFLVMPLLEGKDLDRVLEELGALEPETAVRIALQAARGLTAAHRIGIVHRDVKPGNLILDEGAGELIVKVCDFGIAKKIGGDSPLTATGRQLGTPDYASPEQLKSSKHVDERTDIWSLGATLYQMLCGLPPFAHVEAVFDVISAIIGEDVPHLQDRAPWIDPGLALIVHKALQRDPDQRWATLEDMADALRPFSGGDELLDASHMRAVSPERKSTRAPRADLREAPTQSSLPPVPLTGMDELGLVGQRLDRRYLVQRLIGKGGMGNVYEVEAPSGERLAAKVVSAGITGASPSTLQRFAREAKASSSINSLHVVRTVDAGCDEILGFPYIIMELLGGVDLSTIMKSEGALAPETAVRLVVQAARGVAAAHARGVVHRDIKPANLFLQEHERTSEITVKVCDFGVAKNLASFGFVSAGGQQSLTRSGGVVGSPMYMSPEQARNAKLVTERTDVWSLSVVLWEMLSGQRLWGGQTSLGELIIALVSKPIIPLQSVAPWVPRELARAVHRGLERDPERRTPSMKALIEDILGFAGNSERLVKSQLKGLTERQRAELEPKASLTGAATRSLAPAANDAAPRPPIKQLGVTSTIGGSTQERLRARDGGRTGRGATVAVALLSAAIAGGSAYFFARSRSAARPQPASAGATSTPTPTPTPTPHVVTARVNVTPADALASADGHTLSVVAGEAILRGTPGQTVSVTLQRGGVSKTFSVSIGSDGLASPSRLALP